MKFCRSADSRPHSTSVFTGVLFFTDIEELNQAAFCSISNERADQYTDVFYRLFTNTCQ